MSNINPVFPSAIFSWTDKVNLQDLDNAVDINSTAAEVISIENTLGSNPQIEPSPPVGLAITYPSVSARISDAMGNVQLPVCFLINSSAKIPNTTPSNQNSYIISYDPDSMYNGTDITIPQSGWWHISSTQIWVWWNNGYVRHFLALNGSTSMIAESLIDWQFAGNTSSGSMVTTPRWQQFGRRPRMTTVDFQGPLHKGDRISAYSENGTSNASITVNSLTLKASMTKKISGTFTSG